MSIPTRFGIQGLMPAYRPDLAVKRTFSLPFGGPTGVGGAFAQGQALGCVQVAAQNEVATLTVSGSPTGGTFTPVLTFDKPYSLGALAYNISTANFQAALVAAVPEFDGNVTVTGTAGASYVVTFGTNLADQRIGGLFAVTAALTGGTSPTAAWARTTRGSCGVAQMDLYNSADNNFLDGFLKYDTTLTPGGALVPTGVAGALGAAGQPFQPAVYTEGFFDPADLVGVDANAYTLGKLTKAEGGVYARLI